MSRTTFLFFLAICTVSMQSCNTLYNTSAISLEIMVPGAVRFPKEYTKAAIRYNNCNVAVNRNFNNYFEDDESFADTVNIDSIAAEVYFSLFANHLRNQHFFDTVYELEPFCYSKIKLNDSLVFQRHNINDSTISDWSQARTDVYYFSEMLRRFRDTVSLKPEIKMIDPEFGLYSKEELSQIADSTAADLFLSFDYFAATDGIFPLINSVPLKYNLHIASEKVRLLSCWNFYDLKKPELIYSYRKTDTVQWKEPAYNIKEALRILPPRKDAVLNAADIAGTQFAEFLVPHWIEVERMYYKSGHLELKKTEEMIKQNRWMEAAEIWKKNTTNSNKSIAAKSMFNMALVCEINGNMDAALDWAIKSYNVLGMKNLVHAQNCTDYIAILSQRKNDIKKIENNSGSK